MGTIVVASVLTLIVGAIIWKLVHDKRRGKSACGCSGNCAHCKGCHH